jgi:hypothetical protein
MPLFVLQVACDLCNGVHPTSDILKLDDGPLAKETVAAFCTDRPIPPDLAVKNQTFRCPVTGQTFSPKSYEQVFVIPAPYRL